MTVHAVFLLGLRALQLVRQVVHVHGALDFVRGTGVKRGAVIHRRQVECFAAILSDDQCQQARENKNSALHDKTRANLAVAVEKLACNLLIGAAAARSRCSGAAVYVRRC